MNFDSRIKNLEKRLPPQPGGEFDYARLSEEERTELVEFFRRSGPGPKFDFSEFSDDELEKLTSIICKVNGGRGGY